ncbi:MAG: hypothetical protein ABIU30_04815 [Ferruginibacter sp.]
MIVIRITKITGSSPNFDLTLDGRGKGNGHHIAFEADEEVEWHALGSSGVKSIIDIKPKSVSGSTDIFGSGAGKPTRVNDKKWKAKINNITDDAVYVYSIKFLRDDATDTTIYECDPIITIRPTATFLTRLLNNIGFIVGLFGLSGLIYWRMEKFKQKRARREI